MRKILFIALVLLLYTLPNPVIADTEEAYTYDIEEQITEQLEDLNLTDIEEFIHQIDQEVGQYIPEISIKNTIQGIRDGSISLQIGEIFNGVLRYIFREFIAHSALLGKLIVLAMICVVLQNLQSAFAGSTVGKLSYGITYLVLITVAVSSFILVIDTGRTAVEQMVTFVQALIPILLTLLAAMGGFTSAAFIHPFMMVSLAVITTIISTIVFPMIHFYAVLSIVSHISEKFKVSQLAGLIKDVTLGILLLCMTIFVGALGFQGVTGVVADTLTLRTAKFLTGSFIPVVGHMMTDALEAVVGTSILLKNAIGMVGVLVLLAIWIFPMLKILVIGAIYRLAGALVQPFGESQIGEALQTMSKCINLVFAAVAAVGLMFFIAVSIIIGLGNVTVMMR
ncbi:MAG: stage III sporulation protein AE [Desulfitibacter sp. BRH_c19]|nr:MAG: stage III sporulation protein AE [Desulfitibacter sp. BRH_c19]